MQFPEQNRTELYYIPSTIMYTIWGRETNNTFSFRSGQNSKYNSNNIPNLAEGGGIQYIHIVVINALNSIDNFNRLVVVFRGDVLT